MTKMGQSYASRMAASLLNATGMNDLVTETSKEYEALALELAINPNKLSGVRARLSMNIKKKPIFNTALYTRNLEVAYRNAYENYHSGASVQNIEVKTKILSENMRISQ